ncbi:MAG: hypothetical protein VYD83_01990 [SAR324 cluster bacterium]|nr:hypothetical protein [SAR324 cluster bacterium]
MAPQRARHAKDFDTLLANRPAVPRVFRIKNKNLYASYISLKFMPLTDHSMIFTEHPAYPDFEHYYPALF